MSIIPYNYEQDVVLYDPVHGAVVLYDEQSSQLSLYHDLPIEATADNDGIAPLGRRTQSTAEISQRLGPIASRARRTVSPCPYCGRSRLPLQDDSPGTGRPSCGESSSASRFPTGALTDDFLTSLHDTGHHTFVHSNYFRLLNEVELAGSPTNSPRPSSHSTPRSAEHDSGAGRIGISLSAYSQGYFERFFVAEGELGRGGRGVVYLVEHVLDGVSLGRFACKKVPVGDDHKWLERVLTEVNLLRLTHINLVSYNHVWLESASLTQFGPSVPCVFILQEYCNGGTLEEYVRKRSGEVHEKLGPADLKKRLRKLAKSPVERIKKYKSELLTVDEIGSFFADITAGLNHLHQNGFVHRDIKPSNCLLNSDSGMPGLPRVLVSDFGEGQREGARRVASGATGTVGYSAPETLVRDVVTGEFSEFSFKTDMFSMGMILHYLCFSKLPYVHDFDTEFDELKQEVICWKGFDRAKVASIRNDLPPQIYDLLSQLLSPRPEDRPSSSELLDLIGANVPMHRRKSSPLPTVSFSGNSPKRQGSASDPSVQRRNIFTVPRDKNPHNVLADEYRAHDQTGHTPCELTVLKPPYPLPPLPPRRQQSKLSWILSHWHIFCCIWIGSYAAVAITASYMTYFFMAKYALSRDFEMGDHL
ncbi:kinase-like domain-containing protein [Limtongia smithiae]|uniref:kinase-like domain-containing protein n=1 Tax=Limtongia smithiae TaxID=1125753 RepID=UPI0034CF8800